MGGGAPKLKEHILCMHCSFGTSVRFSTSQMFINVPPVLGQTLQEMAILSAGGSPPLSAGGTPPLSAGGSPPLP